VKTERAGLYERIGQLKPNIFTYSMLFKTMQIELKRAKTQGA
jgi:hypothetical protein